METAAVLRSFNGAPWSTHQGQTVLEKPVMGPIYRSALQSVSFSQVSVVSRSFLPLKAKRRGSLVQLPKASETPSALTSNVGSNKSEQGPPEKKTNQKSTFPNGFEALVLEVCDETDVAELKLKVGDFEMHMKRNIKAPTPMGPPILWPITAPPIPSKPMAESGPVSQPAALPKSTSPFANISSTKASKLAALQASGLNAYVIVSSTEVGSFRKGRTLKGKKQPPSCQEGNIIKEGQIICYLDQFGNELPIKSDVAGKVLKVLFDDGEPVGYGDPLIAVAA